MNSIQPIQPTMSAQSLTANDSQHEAMNYNAIEAEKNRKWQEMMYGSRYQRTMQDIKKAGLNPYILNNFSPGGFGSGGAASIASNVLHNTNRKEATAFDWVTKAIPVLTSLVGAFFGPAGAVIGGSIGSMTARLISKNSE